MAEENKVNDDDQGYQRSDEMIEQYVAMSIDPKQNPIYPKLEEIVKNFGDINGKICVDVGTGPGIMLSMLNNAVGEKGTIYAIDIDKNFLKYCSNKVLPTLKYKNNVKVIESKVDDICLPKEVKGKIDVFLLAFVVNYLQEKERYKKIISQLFEYLSKDGQVVIIDFDQEFVDATFGTEEQHNNDEEQHDDDNKDKNEKQDDGQKKEDDGDYTMDWKYLEPEQIEKLFNQFGFKLDRYILKDVVPHHHCLVFKKDLKK